MAIRTRSDAEQLKLVKQQLEQERLSNRERSKQLQTNLDYLSRDLEVLFASKTWKVGYGIVSVYRRLMNLLGKRQDGQYMTLSHFKNMVDNCEFYTHFKTKLKPTVEDVIAGKFPKNHYEQTQVKVALGDIWLTQQKDKEQHNDH